jgi:Tol biopolymer transport system component
MGAGRASIACAALALASASGCDRRAGAADDGAAKTEEAAAETAKPAEATLAAAELRSLRGALAFVSERDGHKAVHVMDAAGGEPRELASLPGGDVYPGPASADGRWLTLVGTVGDTEETHLETLWALDVSAAGAAPRRLITARRVRNPAFAPDGLSVVVEADLASFSDLYRAPLDGGTLDRLTAAGGGSFQPWFTPAGDIAFTSSRDGIAQIYRMNADGSSPLRLTRSGHEDLSPQVSPDGKQILFTSSRDGRDRLYLVGPDGNGLRPLHGEWRDPGDELSATWSPDGARVAYLLRRPADTRLWITEVATGERRALSAPGNRDDHPAFSPDGRHIVFVSEREGNADLHVARADGKGVARLTRHPTPDWLPRWLPAPVARTAAIELPASPVP